MGEPQQPMTLPEMLDEAQTAEEFGAVLNAFFAALDHARQKEQD